MSLNCTSKTYRESVFLHFCYYCHLLPYHSPYESLCFQSCLSAIHSPQRSCGDLSKILIKSYLSNSYNLLKWFLATHKIKTSFCGLQRPTWSNLCSPHQLHLLPLLFSPPFSAHAGPIFVLRHTELVLILAFWHCLFLLPEIFSLIPSWLLSLFIISNEDLYPPLITYTLLL